MYEKELEDKEMQKRDDIHLSDKHFSPNKTQSDYHLELGEKISAAAQTIGDSVDILVPRMLLQDKRKNESVSINIIGADQSFINRIDTKKNIKHERKVLDEEMIQNYENEISVLKKHLKQVGLQCQSSEEVLLKRCHSLDLQLRNTQNESESMIKTVADLRIQLEACPNRIRQIEEENETLQIRIEDVRVINQQRQNEIDELKDLVKNLEIKLWEQSLDKNQQEKIFLQRLMNEYDNLLKDYELIKMSNMVNERKLYETRSRVIEQAAKLSELEINLQKVENENSYLRRRMPVEKSYEPSNNRGWDPQAYLTQIHHCDQNYLYRMGSSEELMTSKFNSKSPADTGMMSVSCYGALPSYDDIGVNKNGCFTPIRRSEYQRSRENNQFFDNAMSQSLYIPSHSDIDNVTTPTNDKGQFSILERVNVRRCDVKQGSASFDVANQRRKQTNPTDHGTPLTSGQRHKSGAYTRDSWTERKSEEEMELERRYDQLQKRKKEHLMNLSLRQTSNNARYRRADRDTREKVEAEIEEIDRQLGLIWMTLKQKNIRK